MHNRQSALLLNEENIFAIAPIGEKENKLVELLNEEKSNRKDIPNRTLLIPYLTGNNEDGHWVDVVIEFENNIATRADYYDSLVRSITSKIVQDLRLVYGEELGDNIFQIQNNLITQNDFFSCGPCMIENLMYAMKPNNSNNNILSMAAIRESHCSLLMQNDSSGQDFDAIQSREDARETNEIGNDNKLVSVSNVVAEREQNHTVFDDQFFFPRCEYKVRFKGTSAFNMSDPDFWISYFRSTGPGGNSDRIAKLIKSGKSFNNKNINKSGDGDDKTTTIPSSKSGCMKSPWVHDGYKKIFYEKPLEKPKKINTNDDTFLYDKLLEYKTYICNIVCELFTKMTRNENLKTDVYFENDYPCIMVQIKEFAEIFKKKEQRSLYKIVMAYFTAITNSIAYINNVPIELVNRDSFGHNTPSVSETAQSFRINIGIVPEAYAEVLAESLKLLNNEFLVPLLDTGEKKLKLDLDKKDIDHHNDEVQYYNNTKNSSVELWKEDDSLFNVLCKVGDSKGKKVSFQITRLNKYIDSLTDYLYKDMHEITKKLDRTNIQQIHNTIDYAKPLRQILKKLTYSSKDRAKIINCSYNNFQFEFRDDESQDIKDDQKFWDIIQKISSVIEVTGTNHLSNNIESKNIKNLYRQLEKANLEFIRNSSNQQSEDGYGSSSDCEVVDIVQGTNFYSRKITVATGMRAINLAQFLSIYQAGTTKTDTKYMYYETGKVVENLVQDLDQLRNLNLNMQQNVPVKYIDLNHCAAKGPDSKVDLKNIEQKLNLEGVMVLDNTSATTEKISQAIRLFMKKVPVLLLVSSGVKNEQVGADMNPYGTLRIIARNENDLNKLYYTLKVNLIAKEKLPHQLHNIRRAYKDAGAVVTNSKIYTINRGYIYYSKVDKNDVHLKDFEEDDSALPETLKKIAVLFSFEYEEALNNLIDEHGMSLESIISLDWETLKKIAVLYSDEYDNERDNLINRYGMSLEPIFSDWDLKKIQFLGSVDVADVVDKFDDDDTFDQIRKWYDEDHNLVSRIVRVILDSELDDLSIMDFDSIVDEYKRIVQDLQEQSSEYYYEICIIGTNIIDIIVNEKQNYDIDDDFISIPRSSDEESDYYTAYCDRFKDSDRSSSNSSSAEDEESLDSDGSSNDDESMDFE